MPLPTPTEAPETFHNRRLAVVGMGIEGRDALALLAQEGAEAVMVDRDPQRADRSPDDLSILAEVDGVIASQGVPHQLPLLVEAARRGTPTYGPMQLFLERCPAPVIGITGSAGKTTTTTLVHRLLQAAAIPAKVGGNIGQGLLAQLPQITAADSIVAEISHTQLLRTTRSPQTAAVLNITPNHLDQFSWDEYQQLKYRLVEHQTAADTVILPLDEPRAARAAARTPAQPRWFGLANAPEADAVRCVEGVITRRGRPLLPAAELRLPGQHNLLNALAALAIVGDRVSDETAARVLREFSGVPHRLEEVAEINGVRFVNDSIGSTPERTLAGLQAMHRPVLLLLGGRDKHLPLDPLLPELQRIVRRVLLFGESGPAWTAWLQERSVDARYAGCLESAFHQAAAAARAGDTVLLSPAGTSFDAYPNFEARGQHFRALVQSLQQEPSL